MHQRAARSGDRERYVPAGVVGTVVTESAASPDPVIELGLMLKQPDDR